MPKWRGEMVFGEKNVFVWASTKVREGKIWVCAELCRDANLNMSQMKGYKYFFKPYEFYNEVKEMSDYVSRRYWLEDTSVQYGEQDNDRTIWESEVSEESPSIFEFSGSWSDDELV